MNGLKWRYAEILKGGDRWLSSEVRQGECQHAVQGVVGGYSGMPRAAVEEGTGRVLYALDGRGRPGAQAERLFEKHAGVGV